ncbi:MAG: hypothetical protein ACHQIH_00185, partial [Ignavibacteria bacterium]
ILKYHKIIVLLIINLIVLSSYSQVNGNRFISGKSNIKSGNVSFADSLEKKLITKKSISALFIGAGGGLNIPTSPFKEFANPTFGILGRVEFASTSIFPFVIGAEVNYFSYNAPDEFKTTNQLSSFKTKILSFGLNLDYSLSKLIRSSFTMPFLAVDVKTNLITHEYDSGIFAVGPPLEESKVSIGAGVGMTLFVFDFIVKYNYMKDNSYFGVYTKIKIPVIRF